MAVAVQALRRANRGVVVAIIAEVAWVIAVASLLAWWGVVASSPRVYEGPATFLRSSGSWYIEVGGTAQQVEMTVLNPDWFKLVNASQVLYPDKPTEEIALTGAQSRGQWTFAAPATIDVQRTGAWQDASIWLEAKAGELAVRHYPAQGEVIKTVVALFALWVIATLIGGIVVASVVDSIHYRR